MYSTLGFHKIIQISINYYKTVRERKKNHSKVINKSGIEI